MLKQLLEGFINLDQKDQDKYIQIIQGVIFPIKMYVLLIVILLFTLVCLNIYKLNSNKLNI
jgi:hypothetical protein